MVSNVNATSGLNNRNMIEPPNCMYRFVQWFRGKEGSTVWKVAALALPVIALLGIGLLVKSLVFSALVTLLPATLLGLWASLENSVFNKNKAAIEMQPMPAETAAMREKIEWAFGGREKFDQVPLLDIGQYDRPYLDQLMPENLTHPIMRGTMGPGGRPFIAIRIKDSNPNSCRKFVLAFFQRYSNNPEMWCCGKRGSIYQSPFESGIRLRECQMIHQIVVEKNHPRFTLV